MSEFHQKGKESFLDEAFPKRPYHSNPPETLKKNFKAWHRPRKQWVRKYQWVQEIERLVIDLHLSNSRPLKYLSLPGKDMLDIRYIQSWCQDNKICLKFLGYNDPNDSADPQDAELNISQAEIAQRNYIDLDSQVVIDKFESIGDTKSTAYNSMVAVGHFDVVNLDFCKSVAKEAPLTNLDNMYNAIYNLILFQKTKRTEPWLLFITTRADSETVNIAAGKKFFKCIENNANSHELFKERISNEFGIDFDSKNPIDKITYDHLIGLGFGKWLLNLLFDGHPKWGLEMLTSAEYKVNPSSSRPDMLSLVFKCIPIVQPPNDNVGLVTSIVATTHMPIEEKDFALSLIDPVKGMMDIDERLNDDQKLRIELIEEAACLMTDARYDGIKFKSWAMSS